MTILTSSFLLLFSCTSQTSILEKASSASRIKPKQIVILNVPAANNVQDFEKQVFRLTNEIRKKKGLAPLKANAQLDKAARKHSEVMAEYGYIGHHEPEGTSDLLTRLDKAAYYADFAAENVFGPDTDFTVINHSLLTPKLAMRAWMKSPDHRVNILSPRVKEMGVGYVNGYWTQVFGEQYEW